MDKRSKLPVSRAVGYFYDLTINNRGDLVFQGQLRNAQIQELNLRVRNGRRHQPTAGSGTNAGIDGRGALAIQRVVSHRALEYEGHTALARDFRVDLDGDGTSDQVGGFGPFADEFIEPGDDNLLQFLGRYETTSGEIRWGHFRGRDLRIDKPVCEGIVNTSAHPGQLIACGSRRLADDDVMLRMLGMPTGSSGYVISSRTPGFAAQPAGSEGNLCMGGQIGRWTGQVFSVDATGRAQVRFRLNAIPQPMGSVAAIVGERWYVQAWYRDSSLNGPTSNFTSASVLSFE